MWRWQMPKTHSLIKKDCAWHCGVARRSGFTRTVLQFESIQHAQSDIQVRTFQLKIIVRDTAVSHHNPALQALYFDLKMYAVWHVSADFPVQEQLSKTLRCRTTFLLHKQCASIWKSAQIQLWGCENGYRRHAKYHERIPRPWRQWSGMSLLCVCIPRFWTTRR